jgi:hypothetical protein
MISVRPVTFFSVVPALALLAGTMAPACAVAQDTLTSGPARVELRQTSGRWQLFVNKKPFFIKGAGLEYGDQEKLAAAGGNSFRTWGLDSDNQREQQMLNQAAKNGLYVTMGLEMPLERHGFDYSDSNAVAAHLKEVQEEVMAYKDHPAVLMWDIGNELNLNSTNPKVWDAVNDVSKMIHRIDPNHPTTTSLAGISRELASQIKQRAPDLDLLCVQSYADIVNLPRELRESGWDGPYVVSEWGATGHWECGRTDWGAPIEDNSSAKANFYLKRYRIAIASATNDCLGSYVFFWGQKQERTPTWYGLFLGSGEETEAVDVMQYIWTGQWPQMRSPHLQSFWLNGKTANQSIYLSPGHIYDAKVGAQSPDNASLSYRWDIMEESAATSVGGDFETAPRVLPGLTARGPGGRAQITAPNKPGAYRLYVYAFDNRGKAAYANIPFYVDAKIASNIEP